MRTVSSLTPLTSLNLDSCRELTDAGMLAVSSVTTRSILFFCVKLTDEGARAVHEQPICAHDS
jgi:hypothetical protein